MFNLKTDNKSPYATADQPLLFILFINEGFPFTNLSIVTASSDSMCNSFGDIFPLSHSLVHKIIQQIFWTSNINLICDLMVKVTYTCTCLNINVHKISN